MNKIKQSFFFQVLKLKEAEDSLCVELKKVKLEVILKVEAHKIFVLCSKEVMQQCLIKEKRSSRGVFFFVV